jgi:hypothetical protein
MGNWRGVGRGAAVPRVPQPGGDEGTPEVDEIEFAQQFTPSGPPTVNDVLSRRLAPDWEEIEAARRERASADAAEAARENMALANRQFGDPLGNATRAQMAVAEARDKVRHLEEQLETARGVLHRAAGEYVDWQEQAEIVTATASRSAPHDLLAGAREALTDHQVRQMAAQRSQAPGRHPKGHGGLARRSEVTCHECIAAGASPEESWLIHQDPDAQIEAEMVDLSEMTVAAFGRQDRAERRTYTGSVISR